MKPPHNIFNLNSPFVKGRGPLAVRDLKSSVFSSSAPLQRGSAESARRRGVLFLLLSPLLLTLFSLFSFPSSASAAILGKPPNNLGLVNYWSLNEGTGTKATDASGTGNTGTLTGGPTWVTGRYGQAVSFDGTDDYVSITDNSLASGSSITPSLWFNQTSSKTVGLFASAAASDAPGEFTMLVNSNGTVSFIAWISGGGDRPHLNAASAAVSYGAWHHAVGVYDVSAGYAYIYIDGVLSGSTNTTLNSTTWNGPAIGSGGVGGSTTYFMNGKMDDVRIYNRALTAAQVAALYGSGSAIRKGVSGNSLVGHWTFDEATGTLAGDSSGLGYTGTLTGSNGLPTWTSGRRGAGLNFDGSDDYVSASGISELTSINSTSVWFKPTSFSVGMNGYLIDQGINNHQIQVYDGDDSDGLPKIACDSQLPAEATELPTAATWYHVTCVANGTTVSVYLNGVLNWSTARVSASPSTINIGRYGGTGNHFNGIIDDVRIYNRVLSAAEADALYTSNAQKINSSQNTRITSGLVGLWSFNGGDISNGVALDRSGQGNNGNLFNIATSTFYDAGKVGQGFNFDGSNDYVKLPTDVSVNGNGTIAFWFNINAFDKIPIGRNNDNDTYIHLSNATTIVVQTDTTATAKTFTVPTISTGVWYHLAVTRTSDTTRVYLNGTESSTGGQAQNPDYITVNQIGRYGDGTAGYWYNGLLDEVRIYNRGLTAAEVKQLYDMGR
ncbi:MAG: LamG domain-containing protein [bacterium]|nr:LamG domain-containing protein [bacterium]